MMNCADVRENISAYADDELSAAERKSFEEHISSCPECREELDEMVRIIKLCRSVPLYDLPEGFRDGLHEKLTAAAKDLNASGAEKTKRKWTAKTFASIAAGILLIFLGGSIMRFGLLSARLGSKAVTDQNATSAGASERPAGEIFDGSTGITMTEEGSFYIQFNERSEAMKDEAEEEMKTGGPGHKLMGPRPFEINRSEDHERLNALTMQQNGAVSFKTSEMYVNAEDTAAAMETVIALATDNNGMLYRDRADYGHDQGSVQNSPLNQTVKNTSRTDSQAQLKLVLAFTETDFGNFAAALNDTFGAANVQTGAMVHEDRTDELNMLIDKANEYDQLINEMKEKGDGDSVGEIDRLRKEKEDVDRQIYSLRAGSGFVTVNVYINPR
ncbi:MAG TPA: anti-sigma factor [Clostridiales bacterium]|nr:anti-sigma factor [Clostridiales bacterium]HPV01011.1 anti-sigma factor [Clostridiales bacterium]